MSGQEHLGTGMEVLADKRGQAEEVDGLDPVVHADHEPENVGEEHVRVHRLSKRTAQDVATRVIRCNTVNMLRHGTNMLQHIAPCT